MLTGNRKVALAVSLFFLLCGMGFAQDWRWQRDRDHDRDDGYYGRWDNDHRSYDHGFRDGRNDREHNRRPHPRHEGNRAYMSGYHAGYGEFRGWRDNGPVYRRDGPYGNGPYGNGPYGNGPYGNGPYGNGPYGNGGYQNAQRIGYDNGFREGERYGLADRNNGHSNRPTHSSTYQNGSSGYSSSYGDKTTYKRAFQEGFRAGYDRGYNSGYRR